MFIGEWNKSVILTYIGMSFAVIGIFMAFSGNVPEAYATLIVAGVCDLFDGAVARRCKRNEKQKLFGVQLDSLVDVLSFLALPIAICIGIGMNKWYHMVIMVVFCICGIARLAYFNVTSEGGDEPVSYYRGLPVTYTALIMPVLYLLHMVIPKEWFMIGYAVVMLIVAMLNVLDIKVVKPRGIAYACFGIMAIVMLILYLVVL